MPLSMEAKDRVSTDVSEWTRRVAELQKALAIAQTKLAEYEEIQVEITK